MVPSARVIDRLNVRAFGLILAVEKVYSHLLGGVH